MKETGIVRRIDELGRVVIPKELRKTLRLSQGEQVEIYTADDALVLRKYSELDDRREQVSRMCEALAAESGKHVTITDGSTVLASTYPDWIGQELAQPYFEIVDQERRGVRLDRETLAPVDDRERKFRIGYAVPMLIGGDLIGTIWMGGDTLDARDEAMCDVASGFLTCGA